MSAAVKLPSSESHDEDNEWLDSSQKSGPRAGNLSLPTETFLKAAMSLKDLVSLPKCSVGGGGCRLTRGNGFHYCCFRCLGGRGDVEKRWRRMEKRHRPDRTHRFDGDSIHLLEVIRGYR